MQPLVHAIATRCGMGSPAKICTAPITILSKTIQIAVPMACVSRVRVSVLLVGASSPATQVRIFVRMLFVQSIAENMVCARAICALARRAGRVLPAESRSV